MIFTELIDLIFEKLINLPLFILGTPNLFSYKSSLNALIILSVLPCFKALMYLATTNKKNLSLKIDNPSSTGLVNSNVFSVLKIKRTASIGCLLIYSLFFQKEKKDIYYQRLSGLINAIIGKNSWYRPKIKN